MTRPDQGAFRLTAVAGTPRLALALLALGTGLALSGCGPNRGPAYGADPVEQKALAIPPDLTAEPLASRNPFPDLPQGSRFHPGPKAADGQGDWAAAPDGNTLAAPVPATWALGTVRASLLMQGVAIAEERQGALRTEWLGRKELRQLGITPPEDGRLRYLLEAESLSAQSSRLRVQGERRDGDEVMRAETQQVTEFIQAVQPAFGKRRDDS